MTQPFQLYSACNTTTGSTRSARQAGIRHAAKPISEKEAAAFRRERAESSIGPILAHDAYLINLASPKPAVWEKSKAALLDEMERCALLGIRDLVMHPGAHLECGEEAGLERIRQAFREIP